jgi:hypothetical protein
MSDTFTSDNRPRRRIGSDMSEHWTAKADRVFDPRLIAEDEQGELWLPSRSKPEWWDRRLNLRRPTHWPAYLRSRLTGQLTVVESADESGAT